MRGPRSKTADFKAGDVGYVKRSQGHFIKNTGTEDLQFVAVFKTPVYQEISLSDWLSHTPPALVAQHLNMSVPDVKKFINSRPGIIPV